MDIIRAAGDPSDGLALDYQQAGPTALRMLVGARLRRLRNAADITREAAAEAIRASESKISRLELGRISFKRRDVADLLALYGVTDKTERRDLLDLAGRAGTPGWWKPYDDVLPGWFEPYLGLEQAASLIRTYTVQFIPDLLQTKEYARSVIGLSHYGDPEIQIERRLALRMRRQEILRRPNPPRLWAVIDETALRRPIGSTATMRAQLAHLIDVAEQPHISLQVMPFSTGGHPAAGGFITFLRFPEADLPDVVYLEQLISAVYLDKPTDIAHYSRVLNRLGIQAEQPATTIEILHRIHKEI